MDGKDLDSLIDRLEVELKTGQGIGLPDPNWKTVWAKAAEIQDGFRQVRYPTKQERENAWQRFEAIRQEASALSQRLLEERRWQSKNHLDAILGQVESSRPYSLFGFDPPDVEEMKTLGKALNQGRQMLTDNKTEMLAEHKQECFNRILQIQEIHDAWWSHLKQIRSTEIQERIRANLEKNHERHRKASEALESYRARADELREKIASAWNPGWAEGAAERLEEIEDKIEDIEDSLEEIEKWIHQDEERLRNIEE